MYEDDLVSVTEYGNRTKIVKSSQIGNKTGKKIRRFSDGTHYEVIKTGEIKQFKTKSQSRDENIISLKRTFTKLRDLIDINLQNQYGKFLTMTYKDNMTDPDRAYNDFRRFYQKFKRYCIKQNFEIPKYISVIEPQARGAWHFHVILITSKRAPKYDVHALEQMWGQGFIRLNEINKTVKNIGAYLMSYVSNIPVEEKNPDIPDGLEEKDVVFDGQSKRVIKGGRLYLYPAGMNIYRTSRGIKRPEKKIMPEKDALEDMRHKQNSLIYTKYFQIGNENFRDTVKICFYKRSRYDLEGSDITYKRYLHEEYYDGAILDEFYFHIIDNEEYYQEFSNTDILYEAYFLNIQTTERYQGLINEQREIDEYDDTVGFYFEAFFVFNSTYYCCC